MTNTTRFCNAKSAANYLSPFNMRFYRLQK